MCLSPPTKHPLILQKVTSRNAEHSLPPRLIHTDRTTRFQRPVGEAVWLSKHSTERPAAASKAQLHRDSLTHSARIRQTERGQRPQRRAPLRIASSRPLRLHAPSDLGTRTSLSHADCWVKSLDSPRGNGGRKNPAEGKRAAMPSVLSPRRRSQSISVSANRRLAGRHRKRCGGSRRLLFLSQTERASSIKTTFPRSQCNDALAPEIKGLA